MKIVCITAVVGAFALYGCSSDSASPEDTGPDIALSDGSSPERTTADSAPEPDTQAKTETWAKSFGGPEVDIAHALAVTDDGVLVVGQTGDPKDAWLLRLDSGGEILWQRRLGGEGNDQLRAVVQTQDKGFIAAGQTSSKSAGGDDLLIVKLDASGALQWQKRIGGKGLDWASEIIETSKGRYVISAETSSWGTGERDGWLLALDDQGNVLWQSTYGSAAMDALRGVRETSAGLFAVGFSKSFGTGKADIWIARLTTSGVQTWDRILGSDQHDYGLAVEVAPDGGIFAAGWNVAKLGEATRTWVGRVKSDGEVLWQRTYGALEGDQGDALTLLSSGELALTGTTWTQGEGGKDVSLLVLDPSSGAVEAQHAFGGTAWDWGHGLVADPRGAIYIAGRTHNYGDAIDLWVLKADARGSISKPCAVDIFNSAQATTRDSKLVAKTVTMQRSAVTQAAVDAALTISDTTHTTLTQCAAR